MAGIHAIEDKGHISTTLASRLVGVEDLPSKSMLKFAKGTYEDLEGSVPFKLKVPPDTCPLPFIGGQKVHVHLLNAEQPRSRMSSTMV